MDFRILFTISALFCASYIFAAPVASPAGTALTFEESSFAKTTLYKSGPGFGLSMAPSGAFGINNTWETTQSGKWFIEYQRICAEAIGAGLALGNDAAIERGLKMIEWVGELGDKVIQGNFFKYDFGDTRYGIIYERGFLCSIPPERWADYAARMADLLLPGGRLVGLFLYGEEPEPPPFPLTEKTAADLFGSSFRLVNSKTAVAQSVPVYQGMERWQEWERIDR